MSLVSAEKGTFLEMVEVSVVLLESHSVVTSFLQRPPAEFLTAVSGQTGDAELY